MRASAWERPRPVAVSRRSWSSLREWTTTTTSVPATSPVSISSAASRTTTTSFGERSSSRSAMTLKISGWVISFSRASLDLSANTMLPSACRSMVPSGKSTSGPKCSRILHQAWVPGMTTSRAIRSASMISAPRSASIADTVLFPEAIPPVSPTSSTRRPLADRGRMDGGRRRLRTSPGAGRRASLLGAAAPLEVLDDVLQGLVLGLRRGLLGRGLRRRLTFLTGLGAFLTGLRRRLTFLTRLGAFLTVAPVQEAGLLEGGGTLGVGQHADGVALLVVDEVALAGAVPLVVLALGVLALDVVALGVDVALGVGPVLQDHLVLGDGGLLGLGDGLLQRQGDAAAVEVDVDDLD